ncbi:MAG: hypothetical protein P9X26_07510 [Candidatus Stygibacter frigidus]|nr:hypothetical protein [Candidatus Stygibacter frigidus]
MISKLLLAIFLIYLCGIMQVPEYNYTNLQSTAKLLPEINVCC